MTIEIVDFPAYKVVIFHSYVELPESRYCMHSPLDLYWACQPGCICHRGVQYLNLYMIQHFCHRSSPRAFDLRHFLSATRICIIVYIHIYIYIHTVWWFGTFFIFPYLGNNHPTWLIFFRGVQTTNQLMSLWFVIVSSILLGVCTATYNWAAQVVYVSLGYLTCQRKMVYYCFLTIYLSTMVILSDATCNKQFIDI